MIVKNTFTLVDNLDLIIYPPLNPYLGNTQEQVLITLYITADNRDDGDGELNTSQWSTRGNIEIEFKKQSTKCIIEEEKRS